MKTALLWFAFVLFPFVCFANGLDKTDKNSNTGREELFPVGKSSFWEPMKTDGWQIKWSEGYIRKAHMKWENGKVSSSDGQPCFGITVDVSGFDYCVLPPEIKTFADIAKHGPYVWRHSKLSSASRIGLYDPKPEKVEQNQIILLRKQSKVLAIKPVEVTPIYPSWEQAPEGQKYLYSEVGKQNYANMNLAKTDKKAPPNWRSMICEWKRLSSADFENPPTQGYETSQGTGTAFLDTMIWEDKDGGKDRVGGKDAEKFFISGLDYAVAFSFERNPYGSRLTLCFNFRAGEVAEVKYRVFNNSDVNGIEDPSALPLGDLTPNQSGIYPKMSESILFRLDDRYVAIQATSVTPGKSDTEPGTVAYKWKYWPAPKTEATQLTQVSTEQSDSVAEELDRVAGVKTSTLPVGRNLYQAGVNFSWEVAKSSSQNPGDEAVTLHYETMLKSVTEIGLVVSQVSGEIRNIKDLSLCTFSRVDTAQGSATVQLGRVVAVRIDGKYMALKPVKVNRDGNGTSVTFEWVPAKAPQPTKLASKVADTNE
jgi:hypothetical protein